MTSDERPSVPAAVKVLDGVVAGACAAAVALFVFGPFRTVAGESAISIRWTHLLFGAAALVIVRHAARPSPNIIATWRSWCSALSARPALADALLAFSLTRPFVLLIGFLAVATFGLVAGAPASSPRTILRELPSRFDANWYAGIAAEGYEWQGRFDRQQNFAFFPAFPMTMKAVGVVTGAHADGISRDRRITRFTWAGLLVALSSFVAAAWYFSSIARDFLPPERARMAVVLIAAYPFALFFSAAYTESLFLLVTLGAWWHFRRHELVRAALFGLVAGLTRPNGCFLSVPLGLIALGFADVPDTHAQTPGKPSPGVLRRLVVAAMPGIGMLIYTVYLYSNTGVWFAWARVQVAWGRGLSGGGASSTADFVGRTSSVCRRSSIHRLQRHRPCLCYRAHLARVAEAGAGVDGVRPDQRRPALYFGWVTVARAHELDTVPAVPGPRRGASVPGVAGRCRQLWFAARVLRGLVLYMAGPVLTIWKPADFRRPFGPNARLIG